jgi:hypothetical protein
MGGPYYRRQETCPYCGREPDHPLTDHVRHAHYRDAAGDYRCPAVVELRRQLGLPVEGYDANVRHPDADEPPRDDCGKFARGEA